MFIKSAQLGGLVKTLIDGLLGVVNKIFDILINPIVGFLTDTIWRGIAGFIYQLVCVPVLLAIDVVNLMFRKLAGLSSYYDKSIGSTVEGDFVYSLITSKAIMNVFWAMVILGVILLIICTFIAVIKSEFTPLNDKNGSNNKWKIITVAVKSLVNMAVVPVCALVGIMIGNALLNTLDQATNLGSAPISGRVFVASAYSCNMVRMAINNEIKTSSDEYEIVNQLSNNCYGKDFNRLTDSQKENMAEAIDNVFASCSTFDSWMKVKESVGTLGVMMDDEASFYDVGEVYFFYHVGYFNFLVFIIVSIVIGTMMIMIMIGLIKRIFTLVTLFVIAPPIVAVTPLNTDGLKKWNTSFIKNTLSAYSSVVCMNLFLIIVRAFDNISFFKGDTIGNGNMASTLTGFGDEFAKIFILIGGLVFVKGLTSEIAGLIGADSAFAEGSDKAKEYAASAGKVAGLAVGGLGFAGSALKTTGLGAMAMAKGAGKGLGAAAGKFKNWASYRQDISNAKAYGKAALSDENITQRALMQNESDYVKSLEPGKHIHPDGKDGKTAMLQDKLEEDAKMQERLDAGDVPDKWRGHTRKQQMVDAINEDYKQLAIDKKKAKDKILEENKQRIADIKAQHKQDKKKKNSPEQQTQEKQKTEQTQEKQKTEQTEAQEQAEEAKKPSLLQRFGQQSTAMLKNGGRMFGEFVNAVMGDQIEVFNKSKNSISKGGVYESKTKAEQKRKDAEKEKKQLEREKQRAQQQEKQLKEINESVKANKVDEEELKKAQERADKFYKESYSSRKKISDLESELAKIKRQNADKDKK